MTKFNALFSGVLNFKNMYINFISMYNVTNINFWASIYMFVTYVC